MRKESPAAVRTEAAVETWRIPVPSRPPDLGPSSAPNDALLAFESESNLHAPPAASPRTARSQPRFTRTQVTFGAVAAIAVVQALLIGIWLTGRVSAGDVGTVAITSVPPGAPVLVDGAARGVTPLAISLASGAHRVDIGSGDARTQIVNVRRGAESSVHVELRSEPAPAVAAPALGGLQVASDPPGAQVSVDGVAQGNAPITLSNLATGTHDVSVRAAGSTVTRKVTVQGGSVASLIISMNTTSEFASGWLAISGGVPAQLRENGTLIGTTEAPRIMLRAGRHEIDVSNAALGYRVRRTVQIAAGQTTTVSLETPKGTLNVNALPWAEVIINGQRVGETPIGNLPVPIGTHEVVFRHPELGEQRRTVVVGVSAPVRLGVDLRKK